MSLYVDPELHAEFAEPPYTARRERLFAPVGPFVVAIDNWIASHQREMGIPITDPRTVICDWRATGSVELLAELTGLTTRTLHRYRTGEARFIELHNADRIALALDIPLPLLAEEFKSLPAMLADERRVTV